MKSVIGSNYRNDQSFVQASIHEDPTIEKDDSKEANLEKNDLHNNDDSYSTYQGNFNIDSKVDVYENIGFGNDSVQADDGFGQNQNPVEADDGFGQKQNPVEAEVGVGHTTVDPTDKDVVQQLDPTDPIVVTKKCREWNIPGNRDDYTFATIMSIMSTISDERIYTGRLFFSKEDLKKILGTYALKEKFEY